MKPRNRDERALDGSNLVSKHDIQNGYDWTAPDPRDRPYAYSGNRGRRTGQVVEPDASPNIHAFGKGSHQVGIISRNLAARNPYVTAGLNRAYAKLVDRVKDGSQAELLTFLGEGREALAMVTRRAVQMRTAYKQLRRGDLPGMFNTLGVPPRYQAHRRRKKPFQASGELGGFFLEISYGWLPSIGDMVSACEVLGSTPRGGPLKGSVRDRRMFVISKGSGAPCPNSDADEWIYVMSRFQVGGKFRVQNPNAVLLNQLGLINPVSTGWELVPFSFLVDQVVNVSDLLNGWTDFYGYERTNNWYSQSHREIVSYSRRACPHPGRIRQAFEVTEAVRTVGVYRPGLALGGPFNLIRSVRRSANNIALLLSFLKS